MKRLTDSLRFRLVTRVWVAMLASFTVGNAILISVARQNLIERVEHERREATLYMVSNLQTWEESIQRTLQDLSNNPAVRSLDPERAALILDPIYKIMPFRHWRFWRADGRLLSHSNTIVNQHLQEKRIFSEPGFLRALQGHFSYEIGSVLSDGVLEGCLIANQPVYPIGGAGQAGAGRVGGVLSFCLPFSRIGSDTGLARIERNRNRIQSNNRSGNDLLEIQKGDRKGSVFFLVSKQGNIVFPDLGTDRLEHISRLSPQRVRSSPWAPFVMHAMSHQLLGKLHRIEIDGTGYYVLSNRISDQWTSVMVVDQKTIFATLRQNVGNLLLLQLATLLITTIAIYIACRRVIQPIQEAGQAIKAISEGQFDLKLEGHYGGELGELYSNINETGGQLKALLQQALEHAATDQQINTAQHIQQSFLVENLPCSDGLDLAASYQPAYEVGADWYDATAIDGITYLVVADVCDKGVASALFMGVFRTLVRYRLLYNTALHERGEDLQVAISSVNDYMATNHGDTTMFATIFLGSYHPETRTLFYLSAGHEPAILVKQDRTTKLIKGVNGPAVGIFPGSSYSISELHLDPGDVLVLYSDGFPDARSPENEPWTHRRLSQCLESMPGQLSSEQIAERIRDAAAAYMSDAPQFDDMTLMVLQVT